MDLEECKRMDNANAQIVMKKERAMLENNDERASIRNL